MKIIFLDFDGVLVNRKSWLIRSGQEAQADPDCIAALNRITDSTGAALVVSSTWRNGMTIIKLRQLLRGWQASGRVIDKTPNGYGKWQVGAMIASALSRGQEIDLWLRQSRYEIESFVILDDDPDMHPHMHRLVQTQFDIGLTMAHAETAIRMLVP